MDRRMQQRGVDEEAGAERAGEHQRDVPAQPEAAGQRALEHDAAPRRDERDAAGSGDRRHAQSSSAGSTTAVPSLPTTTPAAAFATRMASGRLAPAASNVPSVAITVSPAPDTSYTSRASAGTVTVPASEYRLMPSSERVT